MSAGSDPPWRAATGCVIVRVRVTPKSSLDSVVGIVPSSEGAALQVKVRAAPADGEANAAVARVIAEFIGQPRTNVAIERGGKSRIKSVVVAGDPDELVAALRRGLEKMTGSDR